MMLKSVLLSRVLLFSDSCLGSQAVCEYTDDEEFMSLNWSTTSPYTCASLSLCTFGMIFFFRKFVDKKKI